MGKRRGSDGSKRSGRDAGRRDNAETATTSQMEQDYASSGLPEYLEAQRTRVFCGADLNSHVKYFNSAHSFTSSGVDNAPGIDGFKRGFDMQINKVDSETAEFEIKGVSPAFANALRRILISEVPTMAIEHVFFLNNTSSIPDEIVAHRLGLIPIHADPSSFSFREAASTHSERDTIVLKLKVACYKDGDGVANDKVHSKDLVWLPQGTALRDESKVHFQGTQDAVVDEPVRPVHDDILIAKLSPGQEIELEAHCVKGTGAEHAKWSPVATAWYRLCPEVVLLKDVRGSEAEDLVSRFPAAICPFGIEGKGEGRRAFVKQAAPCLQVLERVRMLGEEEHWRGVVQLRKIKDHFIFTVESTGVIEPDQLFMKAIGIHKERTKVIPAKITRRASGPP